MLLLLPLDPLSPTSPEPAFAAEAAAASALGVDVALLDIDALTVEEAPDEAVAHVPGSASVAVYRGWMLHPRDYRLLAAALQRRGVELFVSPASYKAAHWLPKAYPHVAPHSPDARWLKVRAGEVDWDAVQTMTASFSGPLLVKDYVKSQKHYWDEACFIPDAQNWPAVRRVVERFIELQGELEGGLVFREFVPLVKLGQHVTGTPLSLEERVFVVAGEPVLRLPYWSDVDYPDVRADLTPLLETLRGFPSPFFTVDLAKTVDGPWVIIEVGDGQVSGLPSAKAAPALIEVLMDAVGTAESAPRS